MDKNEIIGKLLDLLVREELPDSIEIGTPSRGGAIKCYGNYQKPEEFKAKIDNAVLVREYAQKKMSTE